VPARPTLALALRLALIPALLPALLLQACPARADTAASLQVLRQCVDATAAQSPTAAHLPTAAPAATARGSANGRSAAADAALRHRCPSLAPALADLGLANQIDIGNGGLDHRALQDLLRLAQRYAAPMPSAAPGAAMLPLALAGLTAPPVPHRSWWQRLEERITQWLGQSGTTGDDWLQQLLQQLSIPQWVLQLSLYAITAAVLLMALWIIGRELRAAGLWGERISRPDSPAGPLVRDAVPAPAPEPVGVAAVAQAPLTERCILLLRLLVQALLQSGRLSAERALTYRELAEQGDFDDTQQRERFAQLAQLAERDRYGGGALALAQWPGVAREADTLYAQLLRPRPGDARTAGPAADGGPGEGR
jgi:hypothetical protein